MKEDTVSVAMNGKHREEITQDALAEFLERREQLAELSRWVRGEQQRLRHLVEVDTPVEPGPLRVRIRMSSQRRLTRAALVTAFGQDGFDYLRGEVTPTEYRHLIIEQDFHRAWEAQPDRSGASPRRRPV